MKTSNRLITLTLSVFLLADASVSRIALAQNTSLAADIVEARKKNAALMKQYSWNSRIEVIVNDETKDTRLEQVAFGPDGGLQFTLLNDQGAALPHGFLRKRLAEAEREKMEKYMKSVRTLLQQYTLPTAMGVSTYIATATIQPAGADGLLTISGNSVVVPGDSMTLWIDAPTRQTRRAQIRTTQDGDNVVFNATYKSLGNGLNHLAFATVSIPAKNLTIQIHNYDYINQNQ